MEHKKGFQFSERVNSFRFAIAGVRFVLQTQHNAWLHVSATVLVCSIGVALGLSAADWKWLVLAITLVWIAEASNTAFEHLCDVVSPEFSLSVKKAKDVAAGAVLFAALGALVLGVLIFIPYVIK
jgi:diacylglycerol kinase (ATP)